MCVAHRYRLYPTPAQEAVLHRHCSDARYVWNLALEMAPEYKVADATYGRIERLAMKYLDDVAGFDREAESIEFGLDMYG